MTNDAERRADARRAGCAAGEGYAPGYLAAKHRISTQQARDLLAEIGPDRERLNLAATVVKAASGH